MQLAGHLGKSLEEVEALSSEELCYWEQFARVEPIGDAREDLRFATLAALILNRLRWSKTDPVVGIGELIPQFWDAAKSREQTPGERGRLVMAKLRGMVETGGGVIQSGSDHQQPEPPVEPEQSRANVRAEPGEE